MRHIGVLSLFFSFFSLAFAICAADSGTVLDDCALKSAKWSFHNGSEFPGAEGSLEAHGGGLLLSYDFSKGGSYVSVSRELSVQGSPLEFSFDVASESVFSYCFRLVDSTGRCFQTFPALSSGSRGQLERIRFQTDSKWRDIWGGDGNSRVPAPPCKSISLCIENHGKLPSRGAVSINSLSVAGDWLSMGNLVKGEGFSFESAGWRIEGSWRGAVDAPALFVKAIPSGIARDASLSIGLPMSGRPQVRRVALDSKAGPSSIVFEPALLNGGNPFNVYSMEVSFKSGDDAASAMARLRGIYSWKTNLGLPRSSLEIKSLPFGTCAHFSYGQSGAFAGWRDYRRLIDLASACGYKWIRDGVAVERDANGNLHPRGYDLDWIKYAKSKGMSIVLVIEDFNADKPIDLLTAEAVAVCTGTKGLVDVFELGNEPNNMGGWLKRYGGTWNGREKDNSTSPWVFEHLKATNAVAKAMKAARPDATLIGIGACPPTNFRYLDIGVADELDGIVEHPYSFSLPPEMLPWSAKHESRDGVKVGDEEGTFAGLVDSYFKKFERNGRKRSLWVTEFGFTSFRFDGRNEKGLYAGYTEEAQAVYLLRRFIQSLTLPVSVSCQYDLIDDYDSNPSQDESNFGIVRSDFSLKPAYYAIQRMNSLFDSAKLDASALVKVEKADLHRAMIRGELVKDWDNVEMKASNSVMAFPFETSLAPGERMLAVWSTQPYQREFNCRAATISISGWAGFDVSPAIGIDLASGATFDVPFSIKGGRILLEDIEIGANPIAVKFMRK